MVSAAEMILTGGNNDAAVYPVRIRFSKTGDLQYISHLDLNRSMQRLMIRAGLPLWYSEGFNPKPKLVFAAPLSVGCEGLNELVDIRLTAEQDYDALIMALNRESTPELYFKEMYASQEKFKAIAFASYSLKIKSSGVDEKTAESAGKLFELPVIVRKHTKGGEKDVDITPQIKEAVIKYDLESGMLCGELILSAQSENYLNPEYIVTALKDNLGLLGGSKLEEWYSLTRGGFFADDMTAFR